uniref:Uncharacterized protein n=1 Tax=Romanomermis culicivorax TaxID=13658 RepID=A0A915K393_ROMCU
MIDAAIVVSAIAALLEIICHQDGHCAVKGVLLDRLRATFSRISHSVTIESTCQTILSTVIDNSTLFDEDDECDFIRLTIELGRCLFIRWMFRVVGPTLCMLWASIADAARGSVDCRYNNALQPKEVSFILNNIYPIKISRCVNGSITALDNPGNYKEHECRLNVGRFTDKEDVENTPIFRVSVGRDYKNRTEWSACPDLSRNDTEAWTLKEASLCLVAAVEVYLVVAVEKRRIYWVVAEFWG